MAELPGRAVFSGRQEADGYVIDVGLIGEPAAWERVLADWRPGARLLELPGDRWLFLLPRRESVRVAGAPGQPVTLAGDGSVVVWHHGSGPAVRPAGLAAVDVGSWVDVSGLAVVELEPVEAEVRAVDLEPLPVPAEVDLGAAAGIRRDPRAADEAKAVRDRERAGGGSAVGRGGVGGRGRAGGGGGGRAPGLGVVDLLLRRTPLSLTLRGRHRRYVAELVEQLERRDYDSALRRAIGLSGLGGPGRLGLRMPGPRRGALRPGRARGGAGAGVDTGLLEPTLRRLYQEAAQRLEAENRIQEAAFVHADLLGSVRDAVNLLERRDHARQAAELAELHDLDPDMVVRLWWRAGERGRAITHALSRGAFAGAVESLTPVDPDAARSLREAWVDARRAAGDPVGAVRAAWPDPALRDSVLPDVRDGIALGGAVSGELLARMVTHRPAEAAIALTQSLLTADDEALAGARRRYVAALADLPAADRAADRRLATAAARSAVRDGALSRHWRALKDRADPLAAADLPTPGGETSPGGGPVGLTAREPGEIAVHDAVVVPGGVLVALGGLGVRLLTPDGRARAAWHQPAHGFVVADHGALVLLLNHSERITDIHRLDLRTRQLRPWHALDLRRVVPSFDGAVLVAQDDDGLVFLDTTADRPRAIWREFGPDTVIGAVQRSPDRMSALVRHPEWGTQIWTWSLPGMTLRARTPVELAPAVDLALSAGGGLLVIGEPSTDPAPTSYAAPGTSRPRLVENLQPATVLATGEELLTVVPDDDTLVLTRFHTETAPAVRFRFPDARSLPGARVRDGRLTAWDDLGRIVSAHLTAPAPPVNLTLRLD